MIDLRGTCCTFAVALLSVCIVFCSPPPPPLPSSPTPTLVPISGHTLCGDYPKYFPKSTCMSSGTGNEPNAGNSFTGNVAKFYSSSEISSAQGGCEDACYSNWSSWIGAWMLVALFGE